MLKGMTNSGFEFEVDERLVSDWRIVKAISAVESKDAGKQLKALTDLVDLFLGEAGEERLMAFLAEKNDGIIPQSAVYATIKEMFNAIAENNKAAKKSEPSPT